MSVHSPDLRQQLDNTGLIGPFPLSAPPSEELQLLIDAAVNAQNPRNLHARFPLAKQIITDSAIITLVAGLFGSGYQLWRTNFFSRKSGVPHPGVAIHHDKHFQNGSELVNFEELGDHLSVVIALDAIDSRNGRFVYLPGSHNGAPAGMNRDSRPFELRPIEDHFPDVPLEHANHFEELNLPAASFCLFHSALLHGSRPSDGEAGRTSMVGRLVRTHCVIPANRAQPEEICLYC